MKIDVDAIRERFEFVKDALDERQRRKWAAAEAASGHRDRFEGDRDCKIDDWQGQS